MKRTLTSFALSDKETRLLRSYVTLMRGMTSVEWEYVDSGPVDLHVVRAAPEEGRRFLAGARGMCVAYGDDARADDDSHIVMPMPMRTISLVQALNEASRRLERRAPMDAQAVADRAPSAALVDVLRRLQASGTRSAVLRGDGLTLAVDFVARTVHAAVLPDPARCASASWRMGGVAADVPVAAPQHPLTSLLWSAGMADVRTPAGAYRLARWPDLGALPRVASFPRLAAWFFHRSGSVAAAAEQTGTETSEVASFLNAALLAGCAVAADDASGRAPAKPRLLGGLVARIRRSLGL